jgi:hypothetical protein
MKVDDDKMKLILGIALLLFGVACATPNGFLAVTEKILGCNKDGFVLLRSEILNRGSYYDWEERTYLDEYRKGEKGRELIKGTLLLEEKCMFPDADTSQPVQRTMMTQDQEVKMGELLKTYPLVTVTSWSGRDWLNIDQGWLYFKKVRWLRSRQDLAKMFVSGQWTDGEVDDVLPAPGGGLFVQLSNGKSDEGEGSQQVRQIFLPDDIRQEMVDHQNKLETYLMVGQFETLEEARALVARIEEISNTQKLTRIRPQIWLRSHPVKIRYRVVAGASRYALKKENYQSWEKTFGVEVLPVSGETLLRRIYRD